MQVQIPIMHRRDSGMIMVDWGSSPLPPADGPKYTNHVLAYEQIHVVRFAQMIHALEDEVYAETHCRPSILSVNIKGYEMLGLVHGLLTSFSGYPFFNYMEEYDGMKVFLNPYQMDDAICLIEPRRQYIAMLSEHYSREDKLPVAATYNSSGKESDHCGKDNQE
jgi:hypothetical protein